MEKRQKKLNTAIIILVILLGLSLVALGGTLLYQKITHNIPSSTVVPDNIISSEEEITRPEQQEEIAPSQEETVTVETVTEGTEVPVASSRPQTEEITENPTQPASSTAPAEEDITKIVLYSRNPDDNTAFNAQNMFPGDVITQDFRVRVSYEDDVTVRFHADVRTGYEKLAEVMMCKVELLTTGELLYDGLMRDLPESLDHALETDSKITSELAYRITAYLDTSVGNEYQNQALIADFRWWVDEEGNLSDNPDTGDNFKLFLFLSMLIGSALAFSLLMAVRKKEGNNA